ncbi:MAG: DUF3391 domain-containing protein, partial [Exilibacterium sp.]
MKKQEVNPEHVIRQSRSKKIPVSELRIGMFVSRLDRDWLDTPFLMQGFMVETLEHIDILVEYCKHVWVDAVEDEWVPLEDRGKLKRQSRSSRYINKVDTQLEHHRARGVYREARRITKNLLDEVAILNKINSSNQISENNLQELREIELNFFNHKKGLEWLHFKNGSLKITPDNIEKVKHDDVPNYILGELEVNDTIISHLLPYNVRKEKTPPIEINPTPEYEKLLQKLRDAKSTAERENINVELANFPELDRYQVKINDDEFIWVRFLRDLAY